ncbi:MAG: choice-of-anchor B family protein [Balneolaceae bacterium]|nr:choice-of-anchor B family protein [Balneolaceae bacterium]
MHFIKRYFFLTPLIALGLLAQACTTNSEPEPKPNDKSDIPFPCENGKANSKYDCNNVDLFSIVTPQELGGDKLNDIWGWTDPETKKQYALVGLTDGVSFVDITEPENPIVIGKLDESSLNQKYKQLPRWSYPSCMVGIGEADYTKSLTKGTTWRDHKVYNNHLYVVSDAQPHGMQAFDLTRLRKYDGSTFQTFTHDFLYDKFSNSHNIVINEETGFAYATGITQGELCGSQDSTGLHMVDLSDPKNPTFAGCYIDSSPGNYRIAPGYIHDAQCVTYSGPDTEYTGQEVCFNSAEGNVVIADVTDKENPKTLGFNRVPDMYYSHQGWLTEDQNYFLMNDELDELNLNRNTKTYIWDVRDLDNPTFVGHYNHSTTTIDHNLYIKGNHAYETNYKSGLRILNLDGVASANLEEVAFFDTQPVLNNSSNEASFDGTWSNFPFFDNGIVILSDISNGLFVVRPNLNN